MTAPLATRETPILDPQPLPYGRRTTRLLPSMRRAFLVVNRYVAEPALRVGLGPLLVTPWTGSIMVLRTRGRRTGAWRSAPLAYLVRNGNVYCCAGFGRGTHWLRNLESDPRVELLMPGRAVSGVAEIVTDPNEQVLTMRALLSTMPAITRPMLGDVARARDDQLNAMGAALPLVRIRVTGLAAGPWDPGGSGWVLAVGATFIAIGALIRRRHQAQRRRC